MGKMRNLISFIFAASIVCVSGCQQEPTPPSATENRSDALINANQSVTEATGQSGNPENEGPTVTSSGKSDPLQSSKSEKPASLKKTFTTTFLCWNIESEGSDPAVIAQQISALGHYNIYAFTEFLPAAESLIRDTLGTDYQLILSRSGRNDRLAIAIDTRLFELVKVSEIKEINFQNRYRSPLVVLLKDKRSGLQFQVMNNHLARGRAPVRETQAQQLVQWARTQLLPTVALGDYNLDYVFANQEGNPAFAMMMKDNVWKWIQPVEMIDTNWYDNPRDPDGQDDYPGSLLDFAFVTGPAKDWGSHCQVIVRPGDFPDDDKTSDHRPFELKLTYESTR